MQFSACWSKLLKSCCGCSSLCARRTWTCTGANSWLSWLEACRNKKWQAFQKRTETLRCFEILYQRDLGRPSSFFEKLLASSMEASTWSGVSLTWFSLILASKQNLPPKPYQNRPEALSHSAQEKQLLTYLHTFLYKKRMALVPAPFCTCAPKTFHSTAEPLKHHRTLCRCWKWRCSQGSKCLRAFIKQWSIFQAGRSQSNPINSSSDLQIYKLGCTLPLTSPQVQSYLWFYKASSKGSEDTFASLPAYAKGRKHGITLTHLLAGCKSAEISVASIGLVVLESSLKLGLLIRSWASRSKHRR